MACINENQRYAFIRTTLKFYVAANASLRSLYVYANDYILRRNARSTSISLVRRVKLTFGIMGKGYYKKLRKWLQNLSDSTFPALRGYILSGLWTLS